MATLPESHRDLLDAELAFLATVEANGMPQQTAIWFLYQDDTIKLSLNTSRRKTRNLEARPQCSLLIPDPEVPQRYLGVRGTVEITPDTDYSFARQLAAKYGGPDLSEHDGPGEGRVVIAIQPTNFHPVDMRIGQM